MSRLLALTVLCSMFISVFSDHDLKDSIFDFESFNSEGGSGELILDFSGLSISTLTEGSKAYQYITGEFITNAKVDSSFQASLDITKYGEGVIVNTYRDACEITRDFYPRYLLPLAGTRRDVPLNSTLCERDARTIHVSPAKTSKDLVAQSKLDEGKYSYEVTFYDKDVTIVGGMNGVFNVIHV